MDEDPLKRRTYFLTFVESMEMIFSQYTEACEVLLDYSKIGGDDDIEDDAKNSIRNILYANIDVHRRILIGVKDVCNWQTLVPIMLVSLI